jgi:hypothetical protein
MPVQDISLWIIVAIVVIIIGMRIVHRFRPTYIAGGGTVKEGRKDSEGWVYAYGRQEKPELIDHPSEKRYRAWRWRELVHDPLKLETQLKTIVPFASSTKEEVLTVIFERGKNDPWPMDPIECCIPNVTGAWGFSSKGMSKMDVTVPTPAGPVTIPVPEILKPITAHYEDQLAEVEKQQRRVQQDSQAEVDHRISEAGRYLRPQSIPRREEQR